MRADMGLLSRKFGLFARCAAVACALMALPAVSSAKGPAAKNAAAHSHKPHKKRAVVEAKPKSDRSRSSASTTSKSKKRAKDAIVAKSGKVGTKDPKRAVAAAKKNTKKKASPKVPASSVGAPNEGKLVGGVKLDTSDKSIRVVPAYKRGDTRWGLPALVHMLERSAKKVAKKHPGAVLGVGDISHKHGGDIFLHRSHESGRDADVAFYVLDHKGKDLLPQTFISFRGSVESATMPGARFDVAKNWALVQAMLEDPVAHVSHIFVADPLRQMLLRYARKHAPAKIRDRAALVMMQPSNALPHDNHFHVRISCPAHMKKSCIEYPAGVFSKKDKKKGKGKLITPSAKPGTKKATSASKSKSAAREARRESSKHRTQKTSKQSAKAAPGAHPGSTERRLASDNPRRKKPIYLQSAVANDDDDTLDRVLFSVPALSHLTGSDADTDVDEADVKASVDETGTVKITD